MSYFDIIKVNINIFGTWISTMKHLFLIAVLMFSSVLVAQNNAIKDGINDNLMYLTAETHKIPVF